MSGLPEKWKEAIHKVAPQGYAYRYPDGVRVGSYARSINGSFPSESFPLFSESDITAALTKLWEEQQAQAQRDVEAAEEAGWRAHAAGSALSRAFHKPNGALARHDAELRKRVLEDAAMEALGWRNQSCKCEQGNQSYCHIAAAAAIRALLDKPESTVREQP